MNSILVILLPFLFNLPFIIGETSTSPVEDITVKFAEPIDDTNKILYDLDQQIQQIVHGRNNEKSSTNLAGNNKNEPETLAYANAGDSTYGVTPKNAEPHPDTTKVVADEKNVVTLLNNLSELDKKLQVTFQDLQTRRRFVLGAMIRQMQSTVRRIRSNVARMQVQLTTIESVATQMPLIRPIVHGANSTALSTEAATIALIANKEIIDQIEERIGTVTKRINEIVTRLSSSLSTQGTIMGNQVPKPLINILSNRPTAALAAAIAAAATGTTKAPKN
ncbi:hypothetical protein RDWZM_007283 [Blomia tropicalis]|uniref:Uncharacterized protein n=1 Tax=Blomia tropicalis TaxID=40697 RepID=A0A9Q0RIY5_BLOTA|nr:hypothetical protein RDWZM_007283 [Blomia tropicalis]